MKKQLFTRVQGRGFSLEQMQSYDSIHGYDEDGEGEGWNRPGGLACCNGIPTDMNFGGTGGGDDEHFEIVIFAGRWYENIYDGCLAYPTEIVARMTRSEYVNLVENYDQVYERFSEKEYEY